MNTTPKLETEAPEISIEEALERKYCLPHFIFLREVRDSTGFEAGPSMDGMAIGLYRTQGRTITGFEIKRSRADWLRELKNPSKAEHIGKYCDFFYLVTSDDSIAKIEELPTPWGWLVFRKVRFKQLKPPTSLDRIPIDSRMLTSLLYRTMMKFKKDFNIEIERQIQEAAESLFRERNSWAAHYEKELKEFREKVRVFEKRSGINIEYAGKDIENIGDAVRMITREKNVLHVFLRDLEYIKDSVHRIACTVDEQIRAVQTKNNDANKINFDNI